jgi:dienelactone hydrolase
MISGHSKNITIGEKVMNKQLALLVLTIFVMLTSTALRASGETFTYNVNGAPYEGYYIEASPNAPLVLLIHDWDGLTDYEIKRANMLADMGYSVMAADLFGKGVRPTENKDKKQHTGELYKDRKKMRALMLGAMDAAMAKGAKPTKRVAMGYCFGGAAVLEMARSGEKMDGFVTFHGGLQTPKGQDYSKALGKFLILHGTADTAITMDQFAGLANELEAAGLNHEMITYSGAPHAFTVFGSSRYREDADNKSWAAFTEFLKKATTM